MPIKIDERYTLPNARIVKSKFQPLFGTATSLVTLTANYSDTSTSAQGNLDVSEYNNLIIGYKVDLNGGTDFRIKIDWTEQETTEFFQETVVDTGTAGERKYNVVEEVIAETKSGLILVPVVMSICRIEAKGTGLTPKLFLGFVGQHVL